MNLGDLLVLYLAVGVACGVAIVHREAPGERMRALGSAAVAVPLWPLWAPLALGGRPPALPAAPGAGARIEEALRAGAEACAGTALSALLSRDAAQRITAEVARVERRLAELDAHRLARDVAEAERRVAALEAAGGAGRGLATARLKLVSVRRLVALRERDAQTLDELADLAQALRDQLLLARLDGSSAQGVGGIVSEVWARVEGLGAAMDAQAEASETSV